MQQWLQAVILGNGAILTNVCILPRDPGLIAIMAGNWTALAGVLSLMVAVGGVLHIVGRSFGLVLPVLLPAIYVVVIALGILMLSGRNPFARLAMAQAPALRNPSLRAYVYGLLLGPITLPCAGPLVVSAFLLGAGNLGRLADGLLYFLFFGLGFGWPLVVLPWLAAPLQRRFTGWMTTNYGLLTRSSGALLILIGLFGFWADLLPNL
mgnify:CR=1 FL=1